MISYFTHIHKNQAIDEIPIFQGYEGIKVILDQLNIFLLLPGMSHLKVCPLTLKN